MLFIEYSKCSTCKRAKKYLDDASIPYINHDIVSNCPTADEIRSYIKISGRDIKSFFNTSGIKYRELDLKNKLEFMSDDEKINLLASDGMLIRRPLLVGDDFVLSGFKEKDWDLVCKKR